MNTDEKLVLRETDARGVVRLTLNRPNAFNALSEGMLTALQAELDAIARDESARVVVLGAAGKAFCAGHDLKEMRAEPSLDYYQRLFAQCTQVMLTVQKLPVPVIARVHGIATAAGCQLVAMCDLAVASRDARFAVSGVNLGLFCSTPSVALSRNLSRKAAFEMLVTGDFIDAPTRHWPRGWSTASPRPSGSTRRSTRWSPPSSPSRASRSPWARRCSTGSSRRASPPPTTTRGQTMACNMMDESALEGVQAFIDKRPPNWGTPRA